MTQTNGPVTVNLSVKAPCWLPLIINAMWLRHALTGWKPSDADVDRLGRWVAWGVRGKVA